MSTEVILVVITLAGLAFLGWWLLARSQKPGEEPFPRKWRKILKKRVAFYRRLDKKERHRFEQAILRFFREVTVTGVETEVDDTDRILVAASGVIPLFGFPGWQYRNLNEVLLYPNRFNHNFATSGDKLHISGMVGSGDMNRLMILSKPALHLGFSENAGAKNVGIHEFVHLLDKADGEVNGVPEMLVPQEFIKPWLDWMYHKMENIERGKSDIRPYGATSEAEFLSVTSEYFFNQPERFAEKHPDLYALMEKMFQQELVEE